MKSSSKLDWIILLALTPTLTGASALEVRAQEPVQQTQQDFQKLKQEADKAYEESRYSEAISKYKIILPTISDDKEKARVYFIIGFSTAQTGNLDAALKSYEQGVKLSPGGFKFHKFLESEADRLTEEGNKLIQNNDYEKALIKYNEAMRIEPNAQTKYLIGNLFFKKGDLTSADVALSKAIIMNERSSGAYWRKGQIAEQKGNIKEAIFYTKVSLLFEDNKETQQALKKILSRLELAKK